MTIYELLGFFMVIMMMRLVFVATRFASSARCNGYGLYHITVNGYLRRKVEYLEWLRDNKVYLWSALLVLTLCVTIIGLIGAFSHNKIFDRPKLVMVVAPIVWLCLYKCYAWFSRRLKP